MKMVFLSNFFNHHQEELCCYLNQKLGSGNFFFVECEKVPNEQLSLGYKQDFPYDFLVNNNINQNLVLKLISLADVIIIGSCTKDIEKFATKRKDCLILRYSERIYKSGKRLSFLSSPKRIFQKRFFRTKHTFILCASAFASFDYRRNLVKKNHMLKWGYFPKLETFELDDILSRKKRNSFLWVGRLIDWKRCDLAIKIISKLRQLGANVNLNIIGTGPLLIPLKNYVCEERLDDVVQFLGPLPPNRVREEMKKNEFFLFTSDQNEGWGAVLNEAMNSACVCIASFYAGSTPYLIKNDVDGVVFFNDDFINISKRVFRLLDDEPTKHLYAKNAYYKIQNLWNAKEAADRLLNFCFQYLSTGEKHYFKEGPISIAEIIKG